MLKPVAIGFALFLASFHLSTAADALDPLRGALPAGAHLEASIQLRDAPNVYAVGYVTNKPFLGIIAVRSIGSRLIWKTAIPSQTLTLYAPAHAGLLVCKVRVPENRGSRIYAVRLRGGVVSSVIAGRASGYLYGDEGTNVLADGFSIRNHLVHHQGSVKYRSVERYTWLHDLFQENSTHRVPDYPASLIPTPSGSVRNRRGDVILVRLEIARTEQQRESGLMNVRQLDPDSGMLFLWPDPATGAPTAVQESFWMQDTYIPLTVAFLSADGTIQELQDMEALSTALHTPAEPYVFALEVNQGFFAANHIVVGDRIRVDLGSSSPWDVRPFMPAPGHGSLAYRGLEPQLG